MEIFLEIAKHLGMQGVVFLGCGYICMYLIKTHNDSQEAQRIAHAKERDEWREQDKSRQDQLLTVLQNTNNIDNSLSNELGIMKNDIIGVREDIKRVLFKTITKGEHDGIN